MKRLAFLFACLTALLAGPAAAQDQDEKQAPNEGTLNAVAYKPVPSGVAIMVRPMDNSDDNMVLVGVFEQELRARGFRPTKDAPLILTFETRDEVGAWNSGQRRHIVELTGTNSTGSQESTKARVNLFNSASGGLLNAGNEKETEVITRSSYRMDVSIDERDGGKRLWQAWAVADLEQNDGLNLTRAMVGPVIQAIGQTVKRQAFPVE